MPPPGSPGGKIKPSRTPHYMTPPAAVPAAASSSSAPTPPALPGATKAKMIPSVHAMKRVAYHGIEDTEGSGEINCIAMNQSRSMMAMSSDDHLIRVYVPLEVPDTEYKLSFVLRGHEGYVDGLAFAPTPRDERYLLSGSGSNENPTVIRLWDLEARTQCSDPVVDEGEPWIWAIKFIGAGSNDERYFVTGGYSGRVKMYCFYMNDRVIAPMTSMVPQGIHGMKMRAMASVPNSKTLFFFAVAADANDEIRLWNCDNCLADPSSKSSSRDEQVMPLPTTISVPPDHQGIANYALDYASEGMMRLLIGQDKGAVLVLQLDSEGRSIGYGGEPPDGDGPHSNSAIWGARWCDSYSFRFVTGARDGSVMVWDTLTDSGRVDGVTPLLREAAPGTPGIYQLIPSYMAGNKRAVTDIRIAVVGKAASSYSFSRDDNAQPAAQNAAAAAPSCRRCADLQDYADQLKRNLEEKDREIQKLENAIADLMN